jgi:YhcH/YjgK/YiaL family protein
VAALYTIWNKGEIKMVFDKLENANIYYGMHKNMEKSFNFIKEAIEKNLPVGKYEIDGDDVFATVQEYENCANYEEKTLEGHRKYIDIQFIVSGSEFMQICHISDVESKIAYNEETDVEFYFDKPSFAQVTVTEGGFGIFFPEDIHKPGLAPNKTPVKVKKVLVKIKV